MQLEVWKRQSIAFGGGIVGMLFPFPAGESERRKGFISSSKEKLLGSDIYQELR